jgi:hypothetical protein
VAVPNDIRVGNALLPGSLRQFLGINDDGPQGVAPAMSDMPIVPVNSTLAAPSLAPVPTSLALPPAAPDQSTPDYAIKPMDVGAKKKENAAQLKAAAKQQQAAYVQSQRMPTLADTTREQQAATAQTAQAIGNQADVESRAADEVYQKQQDAAALLEQNDRDLAAWQEKSDKTRADKEAHAAAMMTDVDATRVDTNRYWKDASTGKHVAWLVSMALAGLGDVIDRKQGGKGTAGAGPVIDMLNKTIDRDVQQQVMDRDAKKERLGRAQADVDSWDRFSGSREARIAGQRAAAKEMVAQQLSIASAKYGSEAAMANGQKAIAELRKSSAKDLQAAVDLAHQHAMAEGSLANAKQNTAIAGGHLKLAKDQFAYSKQKDEADLALEYQKLNAKGDPKSAEQVQKFGVAGVTQPDGSAFIAQGTPEGIEKLREKKAASMTIVNLLDSARRIRTGWTSDTTKSKEWQELQQLWASAKAKGKDSLGLGALSGDDYKILDGYLGSADPTKYQDPTPGIARARKTVIMDLNESLKAHGYQGEYDVPDIVANEAAPTDEGFQDVLKTTIQNAPSDRLANELTAPNPGEDSTDYQQRTISEYGKAGGVLPSQKRVLDIYAANLRSADPKAQAQAVARLSDAANHAESEGVRATAAAMLANAGVAQLANPDEDTSTSTRSGVRDSIATPVKSKGAKR